jgi:hypothetical protein
MGRKKVFFPAAAWMGGVPAAGFMAGGMRRKR